MPDKIIIETANVYGQMYCCEHDCWQDASVFITSTKFGCNRQQYCAEHAFVLFGKWIVRL